MEKLVHIFQMEVGIADKYGRYTKFFLILLCIGLVGCATVNFSANYYTPPENYQSEVKNLFNEFITQVPLQYEYNMLIASRKDCKDGIPFQQNGIVWIPDDYIKYIYQNYYKDRFKILLTTISHEICHFEYKLFDSSTPQAHFQTDLKAIEMVKFKTRITVTDYHKSLLVLRNYWVARKGVGGHLFNVGWNVLNAATLAYARSGTFVDWFATDIDGRILLIVRQFGIKDYSCFKRSQEDDKITLSEGFYSVFVAKMRPEEIKKLKNEKDNQFYRRVACQSISRGLTETEVEEILGKPHDIKTIYENGINFIIWIYKDNTQIVFKDTTEKRAKYFVSFWKCPE